MNNKVLPQLVSPGCMWPVTFVHNASKKRFNDVRNYYLFVNFLFGNYFKLT